jgi:hypothetical protein
VSPNSGLFVRRATTVELAVLSVTVTLNGRGWPEYDREPNPAALRAPAAAGTRRAADPRATTSARRKAPDTGTPLFSDVDLQASSRFLAADGGKSGP